ncbi:MAG: GWxTD domain-containing protein [Bacteroidota bacterium]|jgi:GWxTD domain-containing protein|nr:GWxTD domain-containing protein [Bacteroidota bacterium]
MITRICFFLLALVVIPASAQSQAFRMNIDLASFRYDDDASYVEMYYSFSRTGLAYTKDNDGFTGAVLVHAIVRRDDEAQEPVLKTWRVPVHVADTTQLGDRALIGRVNFLLEPGKYRFAVISRDEERPAVQDSVEIPFEVRNLGGRAAGISDIELASSITKVEEDPANIFYKNTLEIIPNPTLLYGKPVPNLMFYAELYNVDADAFAVKSEVVSSYGRTMATKTHQRSGKHASRVEVGSFNIGGMPSGVYTLILSIDDPSKTAKLSQSKSFYVFNPDIPFDSAEAASVADLIAAEFTAMGESELDENFSMAQYIATAGEKSIWQSLSGSESKRKFLTKFWRDRDDDQATPFNEYYAEYKQRVAVSNEQFRTAFRAGWRTDRGRVYILYGPPDYVDRKSNESDMKPHEIWRYDYIEGGVDFVFVDRSGFNNFELVHSTKRNEIINDSWQRDASTR